MKQSKQKGNGMRNHNSISLPQKAKLFDWCKEHKEDNRPFHDLAVDASSDLGFTVSRDNVNNHWIAVNGLRRETIRGRVAADRISNLELKVIELERRLTAAGA